MATANRILESVCNLPMNVAEARELFRRGALMANAIKQVTTISSALAFAQAETSRIALQAAFEQLNGSELSRLRGTVLASAVLDNARQLCSLGEQLWLLGNDFEGGKLLETRDNYADQTQAIKAAHTPTQVVIPPNIQPVITNATPIAEDHTGLMVAAGGAVVGVIGLMLWAHNRA